MRITVGMVALLCLAFAGSAGAALNVPLVDLKTAASEGMAADIQVPATGDGPAAVAMSFDKQSAERRLLAVRAVPAGNPAGTVAFAARCDLSMETGQAPKLALILFDKAGGSFYKVGGNDLAAGESEARLSITATRKTAFSQGADELALGDVAFVWLGVVIDGAARGTVRLSAPRLTDEPFRPTTPFVITGEDPGNWSVGQDPAVTSTLDTPNEGPDGQACMKYVFEFPGNRHMYAIPRVELPAGDLEGYTALRFTYKAEIPEGISGLLVTLSERNGAQYCVTPPPPPTGGEWKTSTVPLTSFTLGGWTKDDNGQLDLVDVTAVTFGLHGAAKDAVGKGTIWCTDLQLEP